VIQISTVPAPYWPFGISPAEGAVLERMVLDVDRQMLGAGLERHALRNRPALQHAVRSSLKFVGSRRESWR